MCIENTVLNRLVCNKCLFEAFVDKDYKGSIYSYRY